MMWSRSKPACGAGSRASIASAHIYDHAGHYERPADYGPLEQLAGVIQHAVVEAGCRFLRDYQPPLGEES